MNHRERMRRRLGGGVAGENSTNRWATVAPQSIELRIDRLVLEGVAPAARYRIADAVQGELTRLLAARGIAANSNASVNGKRIDPGIIHIDSGMPVSVVGEQIAQSIHGALGAANSSAGRALRS